MKKKKLDRTTLDEKNSSYSSLNLKKEDIENLAKAKELLSSINLDQIKHLIEGKLPSAEKELLPVSIFNAKLTVLESVVKYLKEEKNLSLHKISILLNRDERNVWHIYSSSKKKFSEKFILQNVKFLIPISIFSGKLSALESVVVYLKEKRFLSYHEIAVLLSRDDRTIWTVYSRARKKYVK